MLGPLINQIITVSNKWLIYQPLCSLAVSACMPLEDNHKVPGTKQNWLVLAGVVIRKNWGSEIKGSEAKKCSVVNNGAEINISTSH